MASLRPPSTRFGANLRRLRAEAGYSRFGANLRRLRAEAGYSQEDVAFRAAVHRTQISPLETGERMPRVLTLVCLAGALRGDPR